METRFKSADGCVRPPALPATPRRARASLAPSRPLPSLLVVVRSRCIVLCPFLSRLLDTLWEKAPQNGLYFPGGVRVPDEFLAAFSG